MITVADDDLLLDKLGSALAQADDRLGMLLLSMRVRAESRPMPMLVDTDTAVDVIARSRRMWGITVAAVTRLRAAAATAIIAAVLLVLGLAIAPFTTWWWSVPLLGLTGLAGAYILVAAMKDDDDWSTSRLGEWDRS